MPSITVDVARIFPVGLSVGAYPYDGDPDGTPSGTALDTQTVPSTGLLTFNNLTYGGQYWAVGTVSGTVRKLLVYMPAPPATSVDALNTELFAHEGDTQGVHGIADTALLADAADLGGKVDTSQVGVAGGLATLDLSGHLTPAQQASAGTQYKGVWDASVSPHGSPAIVDGSGTAGDFYFVSVAGSRDLGSGTIAFTVNDRVIYDGSSAKWQRVAATSPVTSVNSRTGAIALTAADVGLGNVNNTSDANKPVSTAQQTALNLKQNADATLAALAALTPVAASKVAVTNAAGSWIATPFTSQAILLVAAGDYTTMRGIMGAAAILPTSQGPATSFPIDTTHFPDQILEVNNGVGTPVTITINTNAATPGIPVNSYVEVFRRGAGTVTFAPAAGVTIRSPQSLLAIADQYGTVGLRKRDTDAWVLSGDLG